MSDPCLRLVGLEIDRKTDVVSLVAFLLSIMSLITHGWLFLAGPQVALQAPEQMVFYNYTDADQKQYLAIAARMAYVNTAQAGYNDAVKSESATVIVGERRLRFLWSKYTASDADGHLFKLNPKGDALPVPINAGGVEAHETSFSPLPNPANTAMVGVNYLEFSDFKKLIETVDEIVVILRYETFGGTIGEARCRSIVDSSMRRWLVHGWVAPLCV